MLGTRHLISWFEYALECNVAEKKLHGCTIRLYFGMEFVSVGSHNFSMSRI